MTAIEQTKRWARLAYATLSHPALLLQAARFAAVGVVNTLVDFAVFLVAIGHLTSSLIVANICSWLVAVTGSFVMNSLITFAAESQGRLSPGAYLRFVASSVFALVANTAALLVAVKLLMAPVIVGKILAIGVSFAVNFSLARFVVFRPRRPQPGTVS